MKLTTANKVKVALVAVLLVVVVIVIFQNRDPVSTHLLFMEVTMPRIVLLFLTLVIGFIAGSLTGSFIVQRRRKPV